MPGGGGRNSLDHYTGNHSAGAAGFRPGLAGSLETRTNMTRGTKIGGRSTAEVNTVLNEANYDEPTWNAASVNGLRNRLEGWSPQLTMPHLHNRVHVWVGGDMGPATSPNDPVFFLNHCNVDRIWAGWQLRPGPRSYVPTTGSAAELFRHRLNDPLYSVLTSFEPRIAQVLDISAFYDYDVLP